MVGCNGYRNPALYAKIASTVDVASHGRLYAGIGAGWYEHEWRAYGYEWPELKDRMGAFREAVQIIDGMWTQDAFEFKGKYYSVDKPYNEPKGVRKPHPSLWIGGGGEKVTLKLVAQYGDAANVGGGDPEVIRQKLAILRRHCETVGRDYDEIIKSTSLNVFPVDGRRGPGDVATERARGGRGLGRFRRRHGDRHRRPDRRQDLGRHRGGRRLRDPLRARAWPTTSTWSAGSRRSPGSSARGQEAGMRTIAHWIDGQPATGGSARTAPVYNPATGEVQAEVLLADAADVQAAVRCAAERFAVLVAEFAVRPYRDPVRLPQPGALAQAAAGRDHLRRARQGALRRRR